MEIINSRLYNSYREIYDKNPDSTVWDAFLEISKLFEPVYITCLKSDIEILNLISQGYSAKDTAAKLYVDTKDVMAAARVWGMFEPVRETLDFNSLLVYNRGMSFMEFEHTVGDISPVAISREELKCVFYNIEKYNDLLDHLDEYEGEQGGD